MPMTTKRPTTSPRNAIHGRDLMSARYSLQLCDLRMLLLAAPNFSQQQSHIRLSEWKKTYNVNYENLRWRIIESLEILEKESAEIKGPFEKETQSGRWLKTYTRPTDDGEDLIMPLAFTDEVAPYMSNLKRTLNGVSGYCCSKFDSVICIRLYLWSKEALGRRYNSNGEKSRTLVLGIDWIRDQLMFEDKYSSWGAFHTNCIKPAVTKINELSDIEISYATRKKGAITHRIELVISKKSNFEWHNSKERQKRRIEKIQKKEAE